MSGFEIILISVALAMDSFAVSITKGLEMSSLKIKKCITIGACFGIFQAIMPLIGFFLGKSFISYISHIDHWIAFILLLVIGIKNIIEALNEGKKNNCNIESRYDISENAELLILGIATSIDALAVGITLSFEHINIWISIVIIGLITFLISFLGVCLGRLAGDKWKNKAGILGGVILIFIGIKILVSHLVA